jgi:hypothetical protein
VHQPLLGLDAIIALRMIKPLDDVIVDNVANIDVAGVRSTATVCRPIHRLGLHVG